MSTNNSSPPHAGHRRSTANLLLTFSVLAAAAVLVVDRSGIAPGLSAALVTGYQWLMLLGGVALLVGVANVLAIHLWRIGGGQRDWVLSLVLVAVLVAVFVAGVVSPSGANGPVLGWVFGALVAPSQAALFSLLVFFMAAAAFRYLRVNRPGGAWLLGGALIVLLAQWPLATQWLPPAYAQATFWLLDGPVMAALRGVLLGSGFALLIVGLRLLLGKA
jgi:hypothetical protein